MSGHAVTRECCGRKSMVWGRGRASGGIAWWKSLLGRINGSSNTRMPTPEPGETARTTYTFPAWQWGGPAAPNGCAQLDATTWDDLLMYDKQGWWQNEASSLFYLVCWENFLTIQQSSIFKLESTLECQREDFRFHVVYFSAVLLHIIDYQFRASEHTFLSAFAGSPHFKYRAKYKLHSWIMIFFTTTRMLKASKHLITEAFLLCCSDIFQQLKVAL